MKSIKTSKKKFNLKSLIGLTYALAISLCMLEYGKPILDQYLWNVDVAERIDYLEEPVRIAYAKPPKTKKNVIVRKDNAPVKEIVPDNIDIEVVPADLPDIDADIDFDIPEDTAWAPTINLEPLESFMLDKQPDCAPIDRHLAKELKYPKRMRETGINGSVYLEFVINADGTIDTESYKIHRSSHPDFSKEVKRAMAYPPACKPGRKLGKSVPTIVRLPIQFKLKT
jgi:protein TonB